MKILIRTLFLLSSISIIFAKVIITPIEEHKIDLSNSYFPLSSNQKLYYKVSSQGKDIETQWNFQGAFLISDDDNNMEDVTAFLVKNTSLSEEFFFLNYEFHLSL